MISRKRFVATFAVFTMLLTVANVGHAQQRVRLEARLSGNTTASGLAKFENRGNRQKFSVEIERARPNTAYVVEVRNAVGSVFRATVTTNAVGRFDLNRDTGLGQSVPSISRGYSVTVSLSSTGSIILRGRL